MIEKNILRTIKNCTSCMSMFFKKMFIQEQCPDDKVYVFHNPSGNYYLTDDGSLGRVLVFSSVAEGKEALREANGGKRPRKVKYLRNIGTCVRCGAPLFKSEVKGYTYQCFACDEDFYKFEQRR